jgi:hypothetical protein
MLKNDAETEIFCIEKGFAYLLKSMYDKSGTQDVI